MLNDAWCEWLAHWGLGVCGLWHVAFSEARRRGFSAGTPASSLPTSVLNLNDYVEVPRSLVLYDVGGGGGGGGGGWGCANY